MLAGPAKTAFPRRSGTQPHSPAATGHHAQPKGRESGPDQGAVQPLHLRNPTARSQPRSTRGSPMAAPSADRTRGLPPDSWRRLHPPEYPTALAAPQRQPQSRARRPPWFSETPYPRAKTPSVSSLARLPATSAFPHCARPDAASPFRPTGGHTDPPRAKTGHPPRDTQSPPMAGRHCPATPWTTATPHYAHQSPRPPPATQKTRNDRLADESS